MFVSTLEQPQAESRDLLTQLRCTWIGGQMLIRVPTSSCSAFCSGLRLALALARGKDPDCLAGVWVHADFAVHYFPLLMTISRPSFAPPSGTSGVAGFVVYINAFSRPFHSPFGITSRKPTTLHKPQENWYRLPVRSCFLLPLLRRRCPEPPAISKSILFLSHPYPTFAGCSQACDRASATILPSHFF